MIQEYVNQYRHLWRTFEKIVKDFSRTSWFSSGFALTTPARTAFHIIKSTKFYINDSTPMMYKSGKIVEQKRENLEMEDLPAKEDVLFMINSVTEKTDKWLQNIDFQEDNIEFEWTGKTKLSIVLFLLKHSQYHLGEINALLNEDKKGKARDHFAYSL